MTTLRKLTMLAMAGVVAAALIACGDDDDDGSSSGNVAETGTPDGPMNTMDQFVPPTDGGMDGPIIDKSSFPKYVKSLIENKTDDKGLPDPETVWGPIPDDEKFVFPATFFP